MALLSSRLPAVLLTGVLVAAMTPSPEGGQGHRETGGRSRRPGDQPRRAHAQALDVADQLVDGGSAQLQRMNLFTDLSSGSIIEVADGSGGFSAPAWRPTPSAVAVEAQDRDVGRHLRRPPGHLPTTRSSAAHRRRRDHRHGLPSNRCGSTASHPAVLAAANPQALPIAQFSSTPACVLRPQVLGDGTLPDVLRRHRPRTPASRSTSTGRRPQPSTAQFQTLARSSTWLLGGPASTPPLDGGVEFAARRRRPAGRGPRRAVPRHLLPHGGRGPVPSSQTSRRQPRTGPARDRPPRRLAAARRGR